MTTAIERALRADTLIDITTIGRRTGKSHRIEIAFHQFDGVIYISGMPGRRDWYANLLANPRFTFHLKQSLHRDLPARAVPVTEEERRRTILARIVEKWGRSDRLEQFVAASPLVAVELERD